MDTAPTMTDEQWREIILCVEREQQKSLQHMNTTRYDQLGEIITELKRCLQQ
jgi:hypothetical protein